jgi:hypothetical protein
MKSRCEVFAESNTGQHDEPHQCYADRELFLENGKTVCRVHRFLIRQGRKFKFVRRN